MNSLDMLIDELVQEAAKIQIQSRSLRLDEIARVRAIYEALPHLRLGSEALSSATSPNLVTYKIVADVDGRLKGAARTACNFWNRFITPGYSVVIRLGIFTSDSRTIARAYKPTMENEVSYGRVEFNTKYLETFTPNEISGTIVHEIGHTLGIGWNKWMTLFDKSTGKFREQAVAEVSTLSEMSVELDYEPGTQYVHWDEEIHGAELMTGLKDPLGEYVLPVTFHIMSIFGHQVVEELPGKTSLDSLLTAVSQVVFTRQAEAKSLDLDYFKETELMETIPHAGVS